MSTLNIDLEINKLTDDLNSSLKKLIKRNGKIILRHYIASQKETMRLPKGTHVVKNERRKKTVERNTHHRERDYRYEEFSSSGDES